jgi:hypothetical protein
VTVLRLLHTADIAAHRTAVCDWAKANGLDPQLLSDDWISIEEADSGAVMIRYKRFKVDPQGRRVIDPDDRSRPWTEELTIFQVVALPALAAGAQADGHGS